MLSENWLNFRHSSSRANGRFPEYLVHFSYCASVTVIVVTNFNNFEYLTWGHNQYSDKTDNKCPSRSN